MSGGKKAATRVAATNLVTAKKKTSGTLVAGGGKPVAR
jgi:hypothetical protein